MPEEVQCSEEAQGEGLAASLSRRHLPLEGPVLGGGGCNVRPCPRYHGNTPRCPLAPDQASRPEGLRV